MASSFFEQKVIWITGASSGIGRELAKQLAEKGAKLFLSSRREDALNQVKEGLTNSNKHHVLPLDLSNSESFEELVDSIYAKIDGIDILINNGGISQRSLALETEQTVDRRVMEVDYFGTIHLTKLVAKKMIAQNKGVIVSVSSVAGKVGSPYRSAYSGAKHALIGFMDCLRAEITKKGVKVQVVCPGWIQTDISRNALTGNMSTFGQLDQEIANGMPVDKFVSKMIKAIESGKEEVVIADGMPLLASRLRRWFPNSFHALIRKIYTKK